MLKYSKPKNLLEYDDYFYYNLNFGLSKVFFSINLNGHLNDHYIYDEHYTRTTLLFPYNKYHHDINNFQP